MGHVATFGLIGLLVGVASATLFSGLSIEILHYITRKVRK